MVQKNGLFNSELSNPDASHAAYQSLPHVRKSTIHDQSAISISIPISISIQNE